MNVVRFKGKTNRAVLAQVKEALGPDALILSNRRTETGIEICAMAEMPDVSGAKPAQELAIEPPRLRANELALAQLKREMDTLRTALQSALGERRWQDSAGKRPVLATVEQRLATLGLGRQAIGQLTAGLSPELSLAQSWSVILERLASSLDCLTDTELEGLRVKAVIGMAGSGKTSTAMAFMQEAVNRYEASNVAAISVGDSGLNDPIVTLSDQLNVRHCRVTDKAGLARALSRCAWAKQVIIDTPALQITKGSQDPVLALLAGQRAGLTALLTLPAIAQRDYLSSVVSHVEHLPIAGMVVSKIDEAVTMGPVLDTALVSLIPIAAKLDREKTMLENVAPPQLIQLAKSLARASLQREASRLKVAV